MRIENMRTITNTFTVYGFEELPESIQESIIDELRWEVMHHEMENENDMYLATLKTFCSYFDITVKDIRVGYEGSQYHMKVDNLESFSSIFDKQGCYIKELWPSELEGKFLLRFLNEKRGLIFAPRTYRKFGSKKCRRSKIIANNFEYSLTGMCTDYSILLPLVEFMQHPVPGTTYEELMDECVSSLFSSWVSSYEYYASDDYIRSYIIENGIEFFGDGQAYA
jgi:hypothetical protein